MMMFPSRQWCKSKQASKASKRSEQDIFAGEVKFAGEDTFSDLMALS